MIKDSEEHEGGVIVLKDSMTGEVLITDIYKEEARESLWKEWMETAMMRFKENPQKNMGMTMEDYHIGNTDRMEGRSDKQVAFLLQNLMPEKDMPIIKAVFAEKKEENPFDCNVVEELVRKRQKEYDRFYMKYNPILGMMTSIERKMPGNICHCERVFQLKNHFSFMGKERLRNTEDVAWIFRQLEEKGKEHSFFVMTKGNRSIILEAGIGNIDQTIVDINAALKAENRFKPEKIYFVHNHPSGALHASYADKNMWKELKKAFKEKLQMGIIINTTSGKYGVFDDSESENREFEDIQPETKANIPVFSFDKIVFDKGYDKRWIIRSSDDVAAFISSQRFGERDKAAVLILDRAGKIAGNFHLPDNGFAEEDMKKIASDIVEAAVTVNGVSAILYGNDNARIIEKAASRITEIVKRQSAGQVNVLDVISIRNGNCFSAQENGMICEPRDNREEKKFNKIEIIQVSDGSGMIRVEYGGVYLPAEKLRKAELENLKKGNFTKEEMAEKYFGQRVGCEEERKEFIKR